MRIGRNPEKIKPASIIYKEHRIIIPVYIPDSGDAYYKNLFIVFKTSINSLLKTLDNNKTNITIINNNCNLEVTNYIDQLLTKKKIDKHVKLAFNYGKVYTVIAEARASFEKLITIADADVFYFSGWYKETLAVFNTFSRVGVVAPLPMPQLAFYNNASLFIRNFFCFKKGSIVKAEDLKLFEHSISSNISIARYNWFKQQLYLEKDGTKACIGAGHFVATYRKDILDSIDVKRPKYTFKDGSESVHLDKPIDKLGYYRLSTVKTCVYHLGNTIPQWVLDYTFGHIEPTLFTSRRKLIKTHIPYKVKELGLRLCRKFITI